VPLSEPENHNVLSGYESVFHDIEKFLQDFGCLIFHEPAVISYFLSYIDPGELHKCLPYEVLTDVSLNERTRIRPLLDE